ncbi:MAG: flagellin [Acidimicrobiia bacterium]|nr:MAG: flagellin [Acidimicrobiia bacterium]
MRINQNIMAFNAYRNLSGTSGLLGKSLEKLSSGFRINRAADDASGLVISQGLRAQVSGLRQATRNAQDGVSVVQTAEGALTEVHSMLNRIRDLIVQAANTASSDAAARQAAQNEIEQLRDEIDRIAETTSFGSQTLLNGEFGAQAARLSNAVTGATSGVTVGASNTFDLVLDSVGSDTSLSVTVTVSAGTYTTAASYETALQDAIDAALSGQSGFTGAVTAHVRDLGSGVWTVELVRNSTDEDASLRVANPGSGVVGVAAGNDSTDTSGGGVFQVGANVTDTNQITVAITDIRISSGTVGAFTALAAIDVTDTTSHEQAQVLIDDAIEEVSTVRGELGAVQNRFESTIANLQITTENLSASESRIRDTDMALEMVTFTRHQILLQAGTAMLAQANAAPQSVLRLLQ